MGKFKEIKLGFLRLEVVQYEVITKQKLSYPIDKSVLAIYFSCFS